MSRINLPYVIDKREHHLAGVLDALLRGDAVQALDIATAPFGAGTWVAVASSCFPRDLRGFLAETLPVE